MGSKNKTKIGLESITNKAGMLQAPVERTPVQLPDKFESNFITTDLIKEIKVTVESIQTLLTTKAQIDMRIAEELATLKSQFTAYAHQKKLNAKDAELAFGEFVQEVFNIKESRANEYIRVTKRKELEGLKLPISNLVELSRLPEEALGEFLEEHPVEELSKLSYRKTQSLVRDNNENSRPKENLSGEGGGRSASTDANTDSDSSPIPSLPQPSNQRDLAVLMADDDDENSDNAETLVGAVIDSPNTATAKLRVAFDSFKQAFESEKLTPEAEALLKEIKEWNPHLAKKAKGV